ncbi:hypothetical protein V490_01144, partial [Pseudogymnoascus sp. VKM F-3557]
MATAVATPLPVPINDAPSATITPVIADSKLPVSVGGKELIVPAVNLLAPIFQTDPLITYFLNGLTREERNAYLPKYFTVLLTAAGLNKGIFYHTDEDAVSNGGGAANGTTPGQTPPWRSGVVLMPPGTAIDNPLTMLPAGLPGVMIKLGLRSIKKMIIDFEGSVKSARKAGLRKGEDPYYVFFVGTAAAHQGRGI